MNLSNTHFKVMITVVSLLLISHYGSLKSFHNDIAMIYSNKENKANLHQNIPEQNPKNVLDYYLMLPYEILGIEKSDSLRLQLIAHQNLDNGYLKLKRYPNEKTGYGWVEYCEIALFTLPAQERKIIAVNTKSCGGYCSYTHQFLTLEDGTWKDITTDVFTEVTEENIRIGMEKHPKVAESIRRLLKDTKFPDSLDQLPFSIHLPEYGTTLKTFLFPELRGEDAYPFFDLYWNEGKFTIK